MIYNGFINGKYTISYAKRCGVLVMKGTLRSSLNKSCNQGGIETLGFFSFISVIYKVQTYINIKAEFTS